MSVTTDMLLTLSSYCWVVWRLIFTLFSCSLVVVLTKRLCKKKGIKTVKLTWPVPTWLRNVSLSDLSVYDLSWLDIIWPALTWPDLLGSELCILTRPALIWSVVTWPDLLWLHLPWHSLTWPNLTCPVLTTWMTQPPRLDLCLYDLSLLYPLRFDLYHIGLS